MASTLDGKQQFALPGEFDSVNDIRSRLRPYDKRGIPIMHPVPDLAGAVVAEVTFQEQLTRQAIGKLTHGRGFNECRFTA